MKLVKEAHIRLDLRRILTSVAERAIRTGEAKNANEFGDLCLEVAQEVFASVLYQNAKQALESRSLEPVASIGLDGFSAVDVEQD